MNTTRNKNMDDLTNIELNIKVVQDVPDNFLDMKLIELRCKHIFKLTDKAKLVLSESHKVGYEYCQWGTYSGHPNNFEWQIQKITKMERDNYEHAIRIVVCKYDFIDHTCIWIDNLHSAVMQLRKRGLDVTLKDIPFYVVDITENSNIQVMSHNGSVRNNYSDIFGAVSCAYKRNEWSNSEELIQLNYTLMDFIGDNYEFMEVENDKVQKD